MPPLLVRQTDRRTVRADDLRHDGEHLSSVLLERTGGRERGGDAGKRIELLVGAFQGTGAGLRKGERLLAVCDCLFERADRPPQAGDHIRESVAESVAV